MKDLAARADDDVMGVGEIEFNHPHASVKKGWLAYVRNGRKFIPDREEVELSEDSWEQDILQADTVWAWLTDVSDIRKTGEDLLAKRLDQERAKAEHAKTTDVS